MNFLELVQRLRRKCRVSGNGPSSVANQAETSARLIDFINEAWMDLQMSRENWNWMRASASFPTVNGKSVYSIADIGLTDYGNWDTITFRNYDTVAGNRSEIAMNVCDYDNWRDTYLFGGTRDTRTRPIEFAVAPDYSIALGPVPNGNYTITGDYFRTPSELVQATDVPALPERFHMIIVYKAMMLYAESEAASEIYQSGDAGYRRFITMLVRNELLPVTVGPALC